MTQLLRDVPLRDLAADAALDGTDVEDAVTRVLRSGLVILGPEVAAFEAEFATHAGAAACVGVASGTDALQLALRAVRVTAGDAVATVSHTAVATVAAIELIGAHPVFVDVDADTYTMSPASLEAAIQATVERTGRPPAAVVVVHLYGQPADMAQLDAICRRHGTALVEDSAQAHGAALDGSPVGSWAGVSAYSFYPTKNLAALGDAGGVTTDDPEIADRVRRLRQYGWRERFISDEPGMNSRLDEVQAAVLRVRLRRLDNDNDRRRAIAAEYDVALAGSAVLAPALRPGARHVYHQYVVRSHDRDRLRDHLASAGVATGLHYPQPVHVQPAYANRVPLTVPLPATEQLQREILSLPIGPELTDEQVSRVCAALRTWSRATP